MKSFTPQDLFLHAKVTEVTSSATCAVASVRTVDRAQDRYASSLWIFDGAATCRQLTRGPGRDTCPRLSPDGNILAFLSDRAGGAPQPYVMDLRGGEARAVASFDKGAVDLQWSASGRTLFMSVALAANPEAHSGTTYAGAPEDGGPAEVCWRLPYKEDGVGFVLQREIHLFSVDLASGRETQLTRGPSDVNGFSLSADGKRIAFSRTREGRFAHCSDLWVCDTDGTNARRLTFDHAIVMQPAWSPDGAFIAFAGALKEGDGESRLWLMDAGSGKVRSCGPQEMEVALPGPLHWSHDSREMVLVRAHRGRHEIVRLTVADDRVDVVVTGDRQMSSFSWSGQDCYFSPDTPVAPSELHACTTQGGDERTLSRFNPWWAERTRLELTAREFEVPDGVGGSETIEAWLLCAKGQKSPMPLLVDAHGGPAAFTLLDFDTNIFWQALCSQGWGIMMPNAVGSSSYGAEFCARLSGHWGEYDLPQYEAVIRQLQSEGTCDARIALSGKSYGGFFASWAIGHTNTFRAAVVMAPVGNIETHYGTSDGGYYADPVYIGTYPAFDRRKARELSPLQYVEQASTPTMFMQGKEDERCPKCQSEELFVSMYRAGTTPTELVLYPGEHHTFLGDGKPSCRLDAASRIMAWVTRFIGQAPTPLAMQGRRAARENAPG